jgi:hypothetical protein
MTTTANKHGLRAAAAERTKKHAQRTALPARPAQMRQEEEAARPAEAIAVEPVKYPAEEQLDSPSGKKANAFADKAEALGWTTTLRDSQTSEDRVLCVATRSENEVITIEWLDGVFDNQTCIHTTPGGRQLKLRNASHALKRMALQPVDVAREDTKVGIHTSPRATRVEAASGTPRAPYFSDDVSDAEVLTSVEGKTITWVNALSGGLESDTVRGKAAIELAGSRRALKFLGRNGFRTVRVSAIVAL